MVLITVSFSLKAYEGGRGGFNQRGGNFDNRNNGKFNNFASSNRGKKTPWNTRNNNYRGGRYGRYGQQGD